VLSVTSAPEVPTDLQVHIASTYFAMRGGLAFVSIGLPVVLAVGGWLYAGLPLQSSMSAYFFAENGGRSMRTWFVGGLFVIGALLYLYNGFSARENMVLNLAGVFTIMVAVFPTERDCGEQCRLVTIHGASAILAFLCTAFVAARCATDTLKLVRDPALQQGYKRTYRLLASLMIASPLVAFGLTQVLNQGSSLIFFAETFGMIGFASYWIAKSLEMKRTQADLLAAQGVLERVPKPANGAPPPA
jgi:hypothetical protein